MPKQINERKILIMGYSCHEGDLSLEVGQNVTVTIHGCVRKIEDVDTDEGTIDRAYKIKQITSEIIK